MTTASKVKIDTQWDSKKKAQVTAEVVAGQCLAAMSVLSKGSPALKEEFENAMRKQRIQALKKIGVNSPISLAKAMAELDSNLYGSNVEVFGDEKEAELHMNECAVWNAMKEIGHITPEQEAQMGEGFQACMAKTLGEFGFKGEFEKSKDGMKIKITK